MIILDNIAEIILGPNEGGTHQPQFLHQALVALILITIIIFIVNLIRLIVVRVQSSIQGKPWIVEKTKDAKHSLVVTQDPNKVSSIPLRRSLNETDGLEFSYSTWLFIEDWEYKKGEWKNVFHKGSPTSWPNRAPGVWLKPNDNTLVVYMNTYNKIVNFVEIDNIPVGKWFHFGLIVKQDSMDTYINGYLKKRVVLDGIPKQNFGNLYVNAFGGFAGYVSRMRYFDYAVNFSQFEEDINKGPSLEMPYSARQSPPYLTPYWWTNEYEN